MSTREDAWGLLTEYTHSDSLLKHALAVEAAMRFYAEKLGLEPDEEREGGLLYRCAAGEFALFQSTGAASGDHTQMAFEVDDTTAAWVRRLFSARGL